MSCSTHPRSSHAAKAVRAMDPSGRRAVTLPEPRIPNANTSRAAEKSTGLMLPPRGIRDSAGCATPITTVVSNKAPPIIHARDASDSERCDFIASTMIPSVLRRFAKCSSVAVRKWFAARFMQDLANSDAAQRRGRCQPVWLFTHLSFSISAEPPTVPSFGCSPPETFLWVFFYGFAEFSACKRDFSSGMSVVGCWVES